MASRPANTGLKRHLLWVVEGHWLCRSRLVSWTLQDEARNHT